MSADPSSPKPEGQPAEETVLPAIERPDAEDEAWENEAHPAAATQPAELIDDAESPELDEELELEFEQPADPLPKATVPIELPEAPARPGDAATDSQDPMPEESAQEPVADEPAQPEPQPEPEPAAATKPQGFGGWLGSLSMAEKFCCAAILAGILGFAGLVFLPALFDFPEETELTDSGDFPLKGAQVEVLSAKTYWQESAMDTSAEDAAVALLPVLDAKLTGKADVRVLFRDGDGEVVGDLLTLDLSGELDYQAVGTAGFKERGYLTAYQAGQVEPWTVEFHEVPAGAEGISEQTLLFKMSVSPTLK